MSTISVALTGNPNTGKTTLFNALTGARQKIGNWPGVTVDKKVGYFNHKDRIVSVVDLPGTYSMNARSAEEMIVSDYLLNEKPDVVVNVLDATNLERNLFLTLQLLESGIPVILDLNMVDEAKKQNIHIQVKTLEEQIGMPVVETVAKDTKSIQHLMDVFTQPSLQRYEPSALIQAHIEKVKTLTLLDNEDYEEKIIELRYALIDEILEKSVKRNSTHTTFTTKLDRIFANGVLALPILLAMMYGVFEITFSWIGQPLADWVDGFIADGITPWAEETLASLEVADWMQSLVLDGIIAGVGGVLTFVPLIFTLFFCLSFLDGTGYMSRVAFIMDPIMRRVGLTGKGVMPLIMGFGCAVPAIMGARALDSEKDRKIAILVTPFLTCGAKLPIMALFAAVFFPQQATNVVFSIYIAGILAVMLMAKLLNRVMFKKEESTFLLELPPYRFPDMRTVLLETWDKGKGFLIKAGTIIFAMSIVIWFLSNYNFSGMVDMEDSFLASIGGVVAHLFAWHGFATWEAGAAVITGILAKEAVVSTLGVLYGVAEVSEEAMEAAGQMQGSLGIAFTSLSAYAFMIFAALYTPCMTALGTIKKEIATWKWTLFSAVYTFMVAWVISLLVYQIGLLLGFGN
ncbi:ferrous iron transport protein B [Anaerosinus gibii]|uniref:Ferrous iron transport protein B n=1 Tax=Selenobaculum gibii TaxID=3054208 RepID=A0A9Y2ERM0_9FIRM|nr:ferrous iron transport protein B [Selenobaculum gbiensis]WIW71357.1 ferrous iron transport protein B [Selenobaculum gbiensis]